MNSKTQNLSQIFQEFTSLHYENKHFTEIGKDNKIHDKFNGKRIINDIKIEFGHWIGRKIIKQ